MQAPLSHMEKPHWHRELIAVWGFAQRNYFLTKRYFWWDLVWLVYTIASALSIGFIGVAAGQSAGTSAEFTTFLLIGTLICSVSLIGFGLVAAVMPLLSPEKGQQVTMIFGAGLLLVSGIYYPIEVLPGWMEAAAKVSPVYYALEGIRAAMLDGTAFTDLWQYIWPLLIMGALFPPLGIWIFEVGERFAKRTGRLKRSG